MEVIVGIAEKSTEQFIQFFYPNYDTQRHVSLMVNNVGQIKLLIVYFF